MKKVLVISTSLRVKGNGEIMGRAFMDGAQAAGNEVELITLANKKIGFCSGCLACQSNQKCIIADDMDKINDAIKNSEVIVFVTPIYFYEMSGQLKTLLDRTNPLFKTDYKFKDIYLLATAQDSNKAAMNECVAGIKGWVRCFDRANFKEALCANNLNERDDMKTNEARKVAYELGKRV